MALHPQAEAALALWAADPGPHQLGGPEGVARRRSEGLALSAQEPREQVARVVDLNADGVPCRLYLPEQEAPAQRGGLVYLHGGGFVFGEVETHDPQARRLANRTGLAVLSVDYRRPPEHRFPAAPDDLDTVAAWFVVQAASWGVDPSRIGVLGDSAGANLALVGCLRNPQLFAAAVLVYPFLDPQAAGGSYATESNAGLSVEACAWFWEQYAAGPDDLHDPDLAPLLSDRLGTLPPTLVQLAEHDVLLDEGRELARLVAAAGGSVTTTTYRGMVHGFWRQPQSFDAAEDALREAAAFLRGPSGV